MNVAGEVGCVKPTKLPSSGKAFLSLVEAQSLTGISAWTLRRDITARRLACVRRGTRGKIRISVADLEAYLTRCRVAAIGE